MTTILTFPFAVWCATAPQMGTFLADGTPPIGIERHTTDTGCTLAWDGWEPELNRWCAWLGDRICQVTVRP